VRFLFLLFSLISISPTDVGNTQLKCFVEGKGYRFHALKIKPLYNFVAYNATLLLYNITAKQRADKFRRDRSIAAPNEMRPVFPLQAVQKSTYAYILTFDLSRRIPHCYRWSHRYVCTLKRPFGC